MLQINEYDDDMMMMALAAGSRTITESAVYKICILQPAKLRLLTTTEHHHHITWRKRMQALWPLNPRNN